MQTYYHPTEFSTTEFWDAVNFSRGANPERGQWKAPALRTKASREQAYRLFLEFVDHVRASENVRFVTANELRQLMQPRDQTPPASVARKLADSIDVHDGYSPAEQLLALLDFPARHVDGPTRRSATTISSRDIPRWAFEKAKADTRGFIQRNGRLPDHVWIGSETLALPDFAATLAADGGNGAVEVRRGKLDVEEHVTKDAERAYNWVIHPKGFAPGDLLELGRLQAWTLKPARLR